MILHGFLGFLCSSFRVVSSLAGGVSSVGGSVLGLVDSTGTSSGRSRSCSSSLCSLIGSRTSCISSGGGLVCSLLSRHGRSCRCSLLRRIGSLLGERKSGV